MKKYFILAFLFSLPLFSFLTITKAQETVDIEASRENLSSCVLISTNVSYKNRKNNNKDDVILLQDFLNSNGYLEADSVTGFFGKITEKAVARFQADNGLVARPEGYVGPGTRTKIQARSCGSSVSIINKTTTEPAVIYFTDADKNQGWYYGDIAQMKKGTPTDWVLVNAGTRSARWEAPIKTETFLPSGCTATSLFSVTTGLTCQTNVR